MSKKVKLSDEASATIYFDGYSTIKRGNSFMLLKPKEMEALVKAYNSRLTESEGLGASDG
jgi:hypothetical protein